MLQVNTIFFFFFQIFSHQKQPFFPFWNRLVILKWCRFGTPPNSQVRLKFRNGTVSEQNREGVSEV